jgi:hypothetical protein
MQKGKDGRGGSDSGALGALVANNGPFIGDLSGVSYSHTKFLSLFLLIFK